MDTNRLEAIKTQLAGVQKPLVDKVKHQSFSGVSSWRYGNGLWMDRDFDADGRLSASMLASSSQPTPDQTLWEQVYGYNAFDSIKTIRLDDDSERHFKYDALSRLTTELDSRVSDEQFYQYDKAGNRTEHRMGEPGQKPAIWSADYLANSNRLQSYGSTQVLLSGSGSTLVETSAARDRRHIYNRRNQIVATYINFQLTGTYAYNALGQRTHKMTPSTDAAEDPIHTVYHYGLSGQLMAETRIDSQTGKETHKNYLWMNRVPVAMTMTDDSKGQQITYLHTDHLNTPRKATNDQQTIVWQWQSDAFGMGLVNPDPDGDGKDTEINLRFAGQYYDQESGLFYNYHRYYDPETGRYSQSDPIGLRGGINTYAYVNSNPLVSTDPLGLFLFAFDGTGMDRDNLEKGETLTNVALFQDYYNAANGGKDASFYQRGVGTDGTLTDEILGGGFGHKARERVGNALDFLDQLIEKNNPFFSGIIDIVGFSRGAAIAREFSNDVFERIDNGHYDRLFAARDPDRDLCTPLPSIKIRFMGLFDTVGSIGVPGDPDNGDFDLTTDSRIDRVAQAVALNEHRDEFSLSSVERDERNAGSDSKVIEQGFIGAHTDVGGGYADGDLSDAPLQWMFMQAKSARLSLGELNAEHVLIDRPVLHDERTADSALARLLYKNDKDRNIFYENDPDWRPGCRGRAECRNWTTPATRRQKTAPQFPELNRMVIEDMDDSNGEIRGSVDMAQYQKWLKENLNVIVEI
ncbi:phospholipase effector Tle1 domain-containing protein [Endozoicomonas acroporae]|uniref:phospholipase effector Tle1 domain-containing protein n=1 Tax=Endozoicomonas acroporae TaxID=1701104 RepID=UPI0023EA4F8B|nr:DUF2235 domain-containing protein [Endozoicomonas acroporae]